MRKRIIQLIMLLVLTGTGFYLLVKAQVLEAPSFLQPRAEKESVEEDEFPSFDTIAGVLTKDVPLQELKKIATAYNKQVQLRFSAKIYALKNNSTKPVEETSMLYEKAGNQQYYRIAGSEYLLSDSLFLYVNHDIKTMSLTTGVHTMPQDQLSQLKHIEDYLLTDSSEAYVSSSGDYKYITITNARHPQVQQYVIKYSPLSFYVEEIRIYMAIVQETENPEAEGQNKQSQAAEVTEEKQRSDTSTALTLSDFGLEQAVYRVVIRYSDYRSSFELSDEHKVKHFIFFSDGEFSPTRNFDEYELNN